MLKSSDGGSTVTVVVLQAEASWASNAHAVTLLSPTGSVWGSMVSEADAERLASSRRPAGVSRLNS
jgi:hypothetical protein